MATEKVRGYSSIKGRQVVLQIIPGEYKVVYGVLAVDKLEGNE